MITSTQKINDRWLSVLRCPQCSNECGVEKRANSDELRCRSCAASYQVVDGVPIMLAGQPSLQHASQQRIFDREFETYESYALVNWRQSYLHRIFAALDPLRKSGARFLDIGAGGSGYVVIEAARRDCEAYGCDLSPTGMQKAATFARDQGVGDRAHFVVCSAERLPFANSTFDAATAISVLEHLEHDNLAAAELARVVVPGGRIFVTVPHAFVRMNPLYWLPYYLHDRRHGHLRHYTAATLARLFDRWFADLTPRHSGRTTKGFQMALAAVAPKRNDWWWALERADLKNPDSPWGGALHMTGTRRVD